MKKTVAATLFFAALAIVPISALAQTGSHDDILRQIEIKRTELSALENEFLSPSEEDRANYAEFLKQPDTGLIRLLPREIYESDTYRKNKKTLTVRGGGAYYSFSRLSHVYDNGTDIGLEQGYLQVGFAGADYGMMTNLGDVPLDEITLEHRMVNFLAEYKAPVEEPKARSEYRRFATGTAINDSLYKTRLPVAVNQTYLLRSISYDASDVLVVLRVVRKDTDGSIIIAWKLLKRNPKPELARNKTEQ